MTSPYQAYLRSPHWQALRKRIIEERGACCEICWRPDVRLEVHHLNYRNLGAEQEADLGSLCRPCHAAVHERWDEIREMGGDELVVATVSFLHRWRNPPVDADGYLLPQGGKCVVRMHASHCAHHVAEVPA